MILQGLNLAITGTLICLAIAFGAVVALIVVELKKRSSKNLARRSVSNMPTEEEKRRRLQLVAQLMALYSGVHSTYALSEFLNNELERRHELWRVRIPLNGPGEIYNLESEIGEPDSFHLTN
jgi:hypothetical protein